ncbi:dinucleotide-utilizing enzyme [Microbacterium sp. GXF6406]
MRNTSLLRSLPFLLLVVLSLASVIVGGWLSTDQISTMTTALLEGTATGVEVYAGQSWVVIGGALVAAGLIGLFLAFALGAAKALLPRRAIDTLDPIERDDADNNADDVISPAAAAERAAAIENTPASPAR